MNNSKQLLSIIVPCYNEEESVPLFYAEVNKTREFFDAKNVDMEFIFVDDGSRDKTAEVVRTLRETDERVHLVSFSRNFGKEAAIYAGLEKSKGDIVVLMDADLQDPPSLLPEMYIHIQEGYDSVGSRRVDRKGEPPIRSWFARRFYGIMRKISTTDIVDGARDFRMMTRPVVDAILSMRETNRFSKGIFGWVGYKTKWLEYENVQRVAGETKWSFWKLFLYSLEGIMAFSTAPLVLPLIVGLLFLLGFVGLLIAAIIAAVNVSEAALLLAVLCGMAFFSGVTLCFMGLFGMYLGKLYTEVKDRPKYLVKEEF
ncbi:MAG: glycosyltransferase family 2 protein [Oscillospiraceae bacterium]